VQAVETSTGTRVTDIGEFVEAGNTVLVLPDGTETPLEAGWTHF
jgi:hypothetical protein